MNLPLRRSLLGAGVLAAVAAGGWVTAEAGQSDVVLATRHLQVHVFAENGAYAITDRRTGTTWGSNPYQSRFGEITIETEGRKETVSLGRCEIQQSGKSLALLFRPLANEPAASLQVRLWARGDDTLEFSYVAAPSLLVRNVRLLDEALSTTRGDTGYVVVPVREGLLIPVDSGVAFTHRFDTYAYEGCHMAMLGVVKRGDAALVTWNDPYVAAEVRSTLGPVAGAKDAQTLSVSLGLSHTARSFWVRFLGPGDYITLAKAYRQVARERGWLVPWSEKLPGHPGRARLFGAVNYKLWSALDRRMNEDSTKEERMRVNWTFDEAAQVAEHLKRDLRLDRVLFLLGGWIHRGYDNQHPDILPAAPECGGDAGLADCSRRVRALGYVFGLHDNYQDIYRDSPSWNEDLIMKAPDGSLAKGGHWAGGRAYLTCAQKALDLARRPQNLPAVRELTRADAYFIDTTYAAGLQECFDPKHPLTRRDDMKWKQALSDYARDEFGIFGSECGREWAIPHSDFFEGLTGVSGTYYHDTGLLKQVGGVVVPLFELVYRDCIAMYGKYGYDNNQAAEYVLHHLIMGRPLNYHSIPPHLYWQRFSAARDELAIRPCLPEMEAVGPHELRISYQWTVDRTPPDDWEVFVHFTDYRGTNVFQNDHAPRTPTSQWRPGQMESRWYTLELPEKLRGSLDVRVGLWQPTSGKRALLRGEHDGTRRYVVARVDITDRGIEVRPGDPASRKRGADPGVFVRADGGWAEGLHPLDCFVKNTYEVLSPLNELTARSPMTRHEFLTPDRKTQRSIFGSGKEAVVVTVNGMATEAYCRTRAGSKVLLPPFGFLVESPRFVAFHARSWNGLVYDTPVLFTFRSLDGRPLDRSARIRVFHGFGDPRVRLGASVQRVEKEAVITGAAKP